MKSTTCNECNEPATHFYLVKRNSFWLATSFGAPYHCFDDSKRIPLCSNHCEEKFRYTKSLMRGCGLMFNEIMDSFLKKRKTLSKDFGKKLTYEE